MPITKITKTKETKTKQTYKDTRITKQNQSKETIKTRAKNTTLEQ
jgi:hypothetical protein